MKRIAILLALLFIPAIAFSAPKIVFQNPTHDFGEVKQGEKLEHVFEFTNEGNEPLIIEKLSSS